MKRLDKILYAFKDGHINIDQVKREIRSRNVCPFCGSKFVKDEGTGLYSHTDSKRKCPIKSIMFTKEQSERRV